MGISFLINVELYFIKEIINYSINKSRQLYNHLEKRNKIISLLIS
jgi:hypothetical protein